MIHFGQTNYLKFSSPCVSKKALILALSSLSVNMVCLGAENDIIETGDLESSSSNNTSPEQIVDFGTTTVTAKRLEDPEGVVIGVAPSVTKTVTGTATEIEETPQSISIVSSQELEKIGATNLKEAVSYSAGVATDNLNDKTSEQIYIRGFATGGETLVNGRRQKANLWGGGTETYGLERVEVLKGPSSIMYGAGNPGGVINQVTKNAEFDDFNEIKAEFGSFDHKQVATDINKQLDEDLALRVIGVLKDSDTSIDYVEDDRVYLAANLGWLLSGETEVRIRAEYQEDDTKFAWPFPADGSINESKWGELSRETYIGDPENDKYHKEHIATSVDFEHQLSDNLTITQGISYFETDVEFDYLYLNRNDSIDQRLYSLGKVERDEEVSNVASNSKLIYEWDYGDIENTTLAGIDYYDLRFTMYYLQDSREPDNKQYFDVYIPNYDDITRFELNTFANASTDNRNKTLGLLLQNQMKIDDKWVANIGGRFDSYEATSDLINLRNSPDLYEDFTTDIDKDNFSLRGGLVYLAENDISPYVSYTESFKPTIAVSDKGVLEPTYGSQLEFGVRYTPDDSDTLITAAVYQIEENNSTIQKPNTVFSEQIPRIDAQGFEFEAKTKLTDSSSLTLAYAFNDTSVEDAGGVISVNNGDPKPFTPKHTASAFLTSQMDMIDIPNLELGMGVRYTGEATTQLRKGDTDDGDIIMRPDYTLIDAIARYEYEDWTFALNVNNLFDEKYVDRCSVNCYFGPPLEVRGSLTYRW